MPSEFDEELMQAVGQALCSHGYADLTMQDIADEYSKSKAALHYHYDSKRGLLLAFQEYIGERFFERVEGAVSAADDDPASELSALLDAALSPPAGDVLVDLQTALIELKAQSPYEQQHRERILAFDERFTGLLAEIIEDGIETGAFRSDLDPDETARFVATVFEGYQVRHVSVGQSPEATRALLEDHLERHVYVDGEVEA